MAPGGERTPIHDPHAKGLIFGLDLTHERGDLFRAILEGIAYGTRHAFETYSELGQHPRAVYAVGGGTRNRVWPQVTSDISGETQIVRAKTVGASYGDAFLAALAVGDVRAQDIATWNPLAHEIKANTTNRNMYDERYRIFRYLYPATRQLIDARQLRPN